MNRRTLNLVASASILASASAGLAQSVVQGPVFNPTTGHRYYLVEAPTWVACEAFAQGMGAHLATVETSAENQWIYQQFSAGDTRKLWIGLNDASVEGTMAWADQSASAYRNWAPGEPGGGQANDYVVIQGDQRWYSRPANFTTFGVIEIAGPIHVPAEVATVSVALSLAADGSVGADEVVLASGNHFIDQAVLLDGAEDRVVTLRGAGAGLTSITGPGSGLAILASAHLFIQDLRLVNLGTGPFLLVDNRMVEARDCVFEGLVGRTSGIGLALQSATSALIKSCTFRNLSAGVEIVTASPSGAFVGCLFSSLETALTRTSTSTATSDFLLSNCTFADIASPDHRCFNGSGLLARLENCIVWDVNLPISDAALRVSYSNIQGGYAGLGNISADPQFVGTGDYRLLPTSPCIDAGDSRIFAAPLTDLAGNPRTTNLRLVADTGRGGQGIDMGCYETLDPDACRADFNDDGFVNSQDFFDFVALFFVGCP